MGAFIDLTGKRFGTWTVLGLAKTIRNKRLYWKCRCDCGYEKEVDGFSLRNGKSTNCGCNQRRPNRYDMSGEYGIGYDQNNNCFYFDKEDYELIKDYCWRVKQKYVVTSIYNRETKETIYIQLHRLLLQPEKNQEIDHINHITYDNRRCNLRIVSTPQNQMNSKISARNTSGVKGVNFEKGVNKWRCRISVNKKRINLGLFADFDKAVEARQKAEEKYYGEYRYNKENIGN